jgi:hypothetical protein
MDRAVASCQLPVASKKPFWQLATGNWQLMIALLALLAGGKAILYDTIDPDCFWHLRVAEQLHRDGIGPLVDEISFASTKTPWTPYSWLAELGMKAIWDTGGYQLAVVVQAMMMAGYVIFLALCANAMTRGRNPMGVILAVMVGMFLSLPYLSFRPVTFALVLLAACTWLLIRDRRMDERSTGVWWIVPITALITNCHFFSIIVPMWVGALLIGAIGERRNISRYSLILALTILACFLTPMLPGVIESIWNYQFADPMVGGGVIAEFQPIWKSPVGMTIVVAWLGLCAFRSVAAQSQSGMGESFRKGEWVWLIISAILLMRLGRFAPLVAPLLSATLAAALPLFSGRALLRPPIRFAVAAVLLMGFVRLALALPTRDTPIDVWLNRHGPDTPGYPTAAASYVERAIPFGRIINEFTWGGYLAWRLGDRYPVLLDGRTQLYSSSFWKQTYLGHPTEAEAILAKSQALAAILPVGRSRFREPLLRQGWVSVYSDDRAEVLFPPDLNASTEP